MKMSFLNGIPFFFLFSYSLAWYSRCDEAGRCTISETSTSEQIYLVPGYLPLFPEGNIIPIASPNSNSSSFSVDAIHGFSSYGKLSGLVRYDCAGGLSECAYSCCKKGYCADTMYSCRQKKDTAELIYILTSAIFAAFIILYWVIYFVLGCKYNKYIVKTQKNQQQYGTVVKDNQINPVNHIIEEQSRDEVDEPGMRTHGSIQPESEDDKKVQVDEEEEKRKKLTNVANRLAKLKDNEGNIEKIDQLEQDNAKEVSIGQYDNDNNNNANQYANQYIDPLNNKGEISIKSKQEDNQLKVQTKKEVNEISDNFDEVNLEDF